MTKFENIRISLSKDCIMLFFTTNAMVLYWEKFVLSSLYSFSFVPSRIVQLYTDDSVRYYWNVFQMLIAQMLAVVFSITALYAVGGGQKCLYLVVFVMKPFRKKGFYFKVKFIQKTTPKNWKLLEWGKIFPILSFVKVTFRNLSILWSISNFNDVIERFRVVNTVFDLGLL